MDGVRQAVAGDAEDKGEARRGVREWLEDNLGVVNLAMIAVLVAFVALLLGGARTSDASIDDVAGQVAAATDLTGMSRADNRAFKRFYGLNASDYDGVVLYTGDSNMDAQELLVVKMGDVSQSEEVSAAMRGRVDAQLQSFEGYGVDQTRLLQDSIIDVQGNYALLVVNGKATEADQAFRDSL